MKKLQFLILSVFIFSAVTLNAQTTYYNFQNEIFDENGFQEKLDNIKKAYSGQGYKYTAVSYKVLSMKVREDSIIQDVDVILSQSNTAPLDINKGIQSLINNPFPNFELATNNHQLRSNAHLENKVTVINLWFTTCRPCIAEIPYLNYLKDLYDDEVQFLSITFDTADTVNAFLKRRDFNFDHLVDAAYFLNNDLKNNAYPKIMVLDKTGTVRFAENGVQLGVANPSQPQAAVQDIKLQIDSLLSR